MIELLRKRRSIRRYVEKPVEKEKVEKIIEAALLSPSSRNIRPWEFIVVDDKSTITKLASSKEHGSEFLKGAPLAIVVIADTAKSDVWVEDASIASIIIQLEAEALGLGSCWVQIRKRMKDKEKSSEDYVRGILSIPPHYGVESIIGIGYPAEKRPPYGDDVLKYGSVHKNIFGQPYKS